MSVRAVILAAGKGTRMKSSRPKPLHTLLGVPVIDLLLDAVGAASDGLPLVVVGHQREELAAHVAGRAECVVQDRLTGTGEAIKAALAGLPDRGTFLMVYGDVPLLRSETLSRLRAHHEASGAAATLLSADLEDPTGYGRIITAPGGGLLRIVEQADATREEAACPTVNVGAFVFSIAPLRRYVRALTTDNAQGELYLTDAFEAMVKGGDGVSVLKTDDADEAIAFNDRAGLLRAEAALSRRVLQKWMMAGVTVEAQGTVSVGPRVELSPDVTLRAGTVLRGRTRVGPGCVLGPDAVIVESRIGAGATVAQSVIEWSQIGEEAVVGPFSRIGAGSTVASGARVLASSISRAR